MERIRIIFEYEWEPVMKKDGTKYLFPNERGSIKVSYSQPAVYRWNAHKPGVPRRYYVGEAQNLKDRLYGYLKPGSGQQTNKEINRLLYQLIEDRFMVCLEVLNILKLSMDTVREYSEKDMESKFFRKFIENLMLTIAEEAGDILLNK